MTLSADEVGFADIATAVSENNAQVCIVFSLFIKCYHVSGIEQLQGVFFFLMCHIALGELGVVQVECTLL